MHFASGILSFCFNANYKAAKVIEEKKIPLPITYQKPKKIPYKNTLRNKNILI